MVAIGCSSRGALSWYKKKAAKRIRQSDEIVSGNFYRKLECSYTWPGDGKQYWDNPKAYRK
jgi:hypothetical protein